MISNQAINNFGRVQDTGKNSMVLLIGPEEISKIELKPLEVIAAVEDAYRQEGYGLAEETPRLEIKISGKDLPHISPGTTSVGHGMAYLKDSKVFVTSYAYHFDFHKYINQIIDPESGKTLAVIKRTRDAFGSRSNKIDTGMLRTGAAAAIGVKYMANETFETVGIIGTGRIGKGSLACLDSIFDFEEIYTHSGRRRDEEFTAFMKDHVSAEIIPQDSIREVVEKSEVIITGTYSQIPIVKGEWLKPGTHISGMGADGPKKSELDTEVFRRASKIIIDSQKCLSIGELRDALEKGVINERDIQGQIGQVVAGKKKGRENKSEITVFESDGTHIQSASVVNLLYRKAVEAGLGIEKEYSDFFVNP
jgi:ornithine cyclodeaminase/alanine dehydrogenase-like protein (mu-crystallin family)